MPPSKAEAEMNGHPITLTGLVAHWPRRELMLACSARLLP